MNKQPIQQLPINHQQIQEVASWRNYFESSGDEHLNYKFFIETAYGCHGSCQGCPIAFEFRNSKDPKWNLERLERHLTSFAQHLISYRNSQNLQPIENLAITIGPGENLYFSESYLKSLALLCKNFKNQVQAKNFHLAVTTSGLFSEDKLVDKIKAMKEVLNDNELSFAFIINLRQFEKTPVHYYRFAKLLMEHINLVELEINMDSDIKNISGQTLINFSQFVKSFPFIQLDFAYAINDGNALATYLHNDDFFLFVEKLRLLSDSHLNANFSQWSAKLNPVYSEDFDFYGNFNNIYQNVCQSSIRLNALGQWHFTKNILGTLYYDENLGFNALAVGEENPYHQDNLKKFKTQLYKFFQNQLSKHRVCHDCGWKNTCLQSGFLSYTKFSPQEENHCSNPAFVIFEKLRYE